MDTTAFPDHPNPSMPTQWPQVYPHGASHDPKLNPNSPVLPQLVPLALLSIASQPPSSLPMLQVSSLWTQPSILHTPSFPQHLYFSASSKTHTLSSVPAEAPSATHR